MAEPLPLDRSRPLMGRDLRHAALALLDSGGAMSISDLLEVVRSEGFLVPGAQANKVLSDALRYEVKRGRVCRVGWGRYAIARLAATTARRVRLRWREAVGAPGSAVVDEVRRRPARVRPPATGWHFGRWRSKGWAGQQPIPWAHSPRRLVRSPSSRGGRSMHDEMADGELTDEADDMWFRADEQAA